MVSIFLHAASPVDASPGAGITCNATSAMESILVMQDALAQQSLKVVCTGCVYCTQSAPSAAGVTCNAIRSVQPSKCV